MKKVTNELPNCPHCKKEINIDEVLIQQFQQEIQNKFDEKLKTREKELINSVRKDVEEETSEQLISLKEELDKKSTQVSFEWALGIFTSVQISCSETPGISSRYCFNRGNPD